MKSKPIEQMTPRDYFAQVTQDDTPLAKALLYLEELAKGQPVPKKP